MRNQKTWIAKFEPLDVAAFPLRTHNLLILFFTLIFTYELAIARTIGRAVLFSASCCSTLPGNT